MPYQATRQPHREQARSAGELPFKLTHPDETRATDVGGSDEERTAPDLVGELPRPATLLGDLRTAWVGFLDRWTWDLFGNHTFREDAHPEAAFKTFRLFISILNRKLYGPRWHKHGHGIRWVCAMERQRRGVVHFHSLLASAELVALLRSSWRPSEGPRPWANDVLELWNDLAGIARISPIDSPAAVRGYVSKYVVKGGEIEVGGTGMGEYVWKGHPVRVDRAWLTTTMGRATSQAILEACASREELAALLAYAEGVPGSRRATSAVRASLRARVGKASVTSGPSVEIRPDRSLIGM